MKNVTNYLPDVLLVAGAAALSASAWLLHPSAGLAVGGLLCMAAGYLTAKAAK